jgi:TonB family protein
VSIDPNPAQKNPTTARSESCLAEVEKSSCQLKSTTPEAQHQIAVVDDQVIEEQREKLKRDLQMAARHSGSIESKPSGKQKQHLLNVLANPAATEAEWMRAVNILGDYQHNPAASRKKKRVALTLLAGISTTAILMYFGYDNGWLPGFTKQAPPDTIAAPVNFDHYLANIQRQVKRNWFPPRRDASTSTTLRWKIFRDGHVENVAVYESSGNDVFDNAAVSAVENTDFGPLPGGADPDVDIEFTFTYNVLPK